MMLEVAGVELAYSVITKIGKVADSARPGLMANQPESQFEPAAFVSVTVISSAHSCFFTNSGYWSRSIGLP